MDHVIESLKRWLDIYQDEKEEDKDHEAIKRIKNAIAELQKYKVK